MNMYVEYVAGLPIAEVDKRVEPSDVQEIG